MYRADGPAELRSLGETQFVAGVSAMSESGKYGRPRLRRHYRQCRFPGRQPRQGHPRTAHHHCRAGAFAASATAPPGTPTRACGSSPRVPAKGCTRRAWREGFAALAPLNLTFEAWMFHTQLGDLVDLARAFPETKIVLNHIGGALAVGPYAGKREEVFEEWRTQIQQARRNSRTSTSSSAASACRHDGLRYGQQDKAPSSEQLAQAWRPYIETCIAAFGPDRSMFESNFPVDKGMCSYSEPVERVQARRRELFERRKECDVLQYRAEVLPLVVSLAASSLAEAGTHASAARRSVDPAPGVTTGRRRRERACHCHAKRSTRRRRNICATNTRSSGSARPPTPAARARRRARSAPGRCATRSLDAGLKPSDIDGMLDYSGGDSTSATFIAGDLGMRLNFYMDVVGGGSSTEALIGIAIGMMEAGLCKMRRDLPLDERLFAGAHRRHRRALGGAGQRRHAAQPRLWLAERRAELRPDLHAPHVRLRHDARAGGAS